MAASLSSHSSAAQIRFRHCLLRRPAPSPRFLFTSPFHIKLLRSPPSLPIFHHHRLFYSSTPLPQTPSLSCIPKSVYHQNSDNEADNEIEGQFEGSGGFLDDDGRKESAGKLKGLELLEAESGEVSDDSNVKLPSLSAKEKKDLASFAHALGKKLKSQLIGKSGITANVVASCKETLEANELLKIKIHNTCPGELSDAVRQLEEATGSVVAHQIGRTAILYRPSLTKLKSEENKKQNIRPFARKSPPVHLPQSRGPAPRLSGYNRRGSVGWRTSLPS